MKKILFLFLLVALVGLAGGCILRTTSGPMQNPDQSGNQAEDINDLIIIDYPQPGDEVANPLVITGKARGNWYFEADFPIAVFDSNGNQIANGVATAQEDWMTTEFVPFVAELILDVPSGTAGTVVLYKDNPSGLPENDNSTSVPVRFSPGVTNLKIFFGNSIQDPQALNCDVAYPVVRTVAKTDSPARVALLMLLKGPNQLEKEQGFFSSINPGTVLQSVILDGQTLKVDFNEVLQSNIGGSCLVSAIRAQITETGNQFPTVENVEISVNGNNQEILQP